MNEEGEMVSWEICLHSVGKDWVRFFKCLAVRGENISSNQDFGKMGNQEWSVSKQVITVHTTLLLGSLHNLWGAATTSYSFCLGSPASFKRACWELQRTAMAREPEKRAGSFRQVGVQNKPTAAHVSHRHGFPSQPSITSSFNPQTWQLFYNFLRSDCGCWELTPPCADHSSQTLNGCERYMTPSTAFHASKTSIFFQAGEWA